MMHARSEGMGQLCKLLGLPKYTTKFTLTAEVDALAQVTVTYYPEENPFQETVTQQFNLVPIEESSRGN